MAVIGVIDIAMRATTTDFVRGMKTAAATVVGWKQTAANAINKGIGGITSGLKSAASGVIKHSGQMASALGDVTSQVAKLGVVAAGIAATGLTSLTVSSLSAIDRQGELADRLGVSGGAFAAFEHAVKLTGGPVEALPEILGKLNGTLGQAARQATPAAAALRQLGLDAKTLVNDDPIAATKKIAEGLSKIESPARRAAIASQIFGEQGLKLAGTLKVGKAGIEQLEAEAAKLGIVLADADYAKVAAANDALDRAGAAITGVGNQIAVALAPFIEAAVVKFTDLATAGGGVGPIVTTALATVEEAIGFVADAASTLNVAFLGARSIVTGALSSIVKFIAKVGKGIEAVINLIPGVEVSFTSTLDAITADLDKLSGEQAKEFRDAWAAPPPSAKLKSFFGDIRSAADDASKAILGTSTSTNKLAGAMAEAKFKVSELETKLMEQVATYGMTSDQVEIFKVKQAGASQADLQRVESISKSLRMLDRFTAEQEKLKEGAKSLFEETRTPFEKLLIEQQTLAKQFKGGLIDKDLFERGLKKAGKDNGFDQNEIRRAGATELGSQEARTTLLNLRQGQGADTNKVAITKTAVSAEQMVKIQTEQLAVLKKIVNPAVSNSDLLGF